MDFVRRSKLPVVVGLVLLLAAALAPALLWPRAAWLFVTPSDRFLVDRALRGAAAAFNTTPQEYKWTTRPVVIRHADRTCVLLGSARRDGAGSYRACYARDGKLIEERALLGF